MKRILAALAALLVLAAPVRAEIAVVYDQYYDAADAATQNFGGPHMQNRFLQAAIDVLNYTGACYTLVPIQATKTSLIADGIVQSGVGIGSSHTYDGVVWLNWNGRSASTSAPTPNKVGFTGCYPCSLSLTGNNWATVPSVPHLLTFGPTLGTGIATTFYVHSTAGLRCSTGVAANSGGSASGHGWEGMVGDETHGWNIASNRPVGPDGANFVASANVPRRGFRGLLKMHLAATSLENDGSNAFACSRCDSALTGLNADDTLSVWEIPAGGVENAAALIFADIAGAGACQDSAGTNLGCEFDAPAFLVALARLDSLTGGGVWCGSSNVPIKASLTVEGVARRGLRKAAGGMLAADSTVSKASDDSLATLPGLSPTFAVNCSPDSLAAYASEIRWIIAHVPGARFTPQIWRGVSDTTVAGLGNTSSANPVDVFGRYRRRAFYGDSAYHYVQGADTSLYTLLKAQRALLAAVVGEGRMSRFLIAPLDDYSPKNLLWSASGWDSLLYAITQAGYDKVRTDVHTRAAYLPTIGNVGRDRLIGGFYTQSRQTCSLNGRTVDFLGQTGHNISGGHYSADTTNGVVFTFGGYTTNPNMVATIQGRFWAGLVHTQFTDYDWFPSDGASKTRVDHTRTYDDMFVPFRHASILKLHVSDLSGLPDGPPARPGWWAVKSIYNQFRAINTRAGRTIFTFAYPEDIAP